MQTQNILPENHPQLAALQAAFANEFGEEPVAPDLMTNEAPAKPAEPAEPATNTPDIKLPKVQIEVSDVGKYHTEPEKLIEKIQHQAGSLVFDVSTNKGRDACRSHAANIIRCITPALNASKAIAAEAKKVQEADLNFRKSFEKGVREIAEQARKPLTEWEAEQERLAAEQARIEAERIEADRLARQFELDWANAIAENELFDFRREKAAREAVEAAERQAREQAEHEQRIKERAIEQERQRIEAEQREREAAKDREIERIENEKLAAIQREEKAKQLAIEAVAKAERDAQAAIEKERQRIIAEAKQKEAEEKKNLMDLAHRARVNNEIYTKLTALGVEEELAKTIIKCAVKRELGAMVVNY